MSANLLSKLYLKCTRNNINLFYSSPISINIMSLSMSSRTFSKYLCPSKIYSKYYPSTAILTDGLVGEKRLYFFTDAKRCMAGHAKWQNVLHTKKAKHLEKANLCNKFVRLGVLAAKEGGSFDPKLNNKLADVLEEARKNSVPHSTVLSALKTNSGKKLKPGTIELVGPGGCFLILEYETENISTYRFTLKGILKKYGLGIPQGEGRWRACYEKKGLIKVVGKKDSEETLNAEKALDSAIEAGAEDVQLNKDENENPYLDFFCAPDDLHSVKKELESMNYKIEEAYISYIPNVVVQLAGEDLQNAGNLIAEIEDMTETVRLYENIQG